MQKRILREAFHASKVRIKEALSLLTFPLPTIMEDNEIVDHKANPHPSSTIVQGLAFWLCYVSILVATLLSALDLTAIPPALPTITADLNGGEDFVWVGSAYALSSTAILPLSSELANAFGRRPVMLAAITLFAIGSALAGAAHNMTMLIVARGKRLCFSLVIRTL